MGRSAAKQCKIVCVYLHLVPEYIYIVFLLQCNLFASFDIVVQNCGWPLLLCVCCLWRGLCTLISTFR